MWPMLLDMSRDECKRALRCLELEAYSNLVSALRAQGELNKEKRKLLQDLASTLNISMERHRAEVRRAVNDEKLATIAEHIAGPNTATEWAIEGRRLVPLMPRLVPQTAFTTLANNAANIAAAENAKLPPPSLTKRKNIPGDESPPSEPNIPEASKTPQCSTSPSAIHLKKDEEDDSSRKRRRSMSLDVGGVGQPLSPPTKVQSITSPQPVPFPVKITLSTALGRTTITTTSAASTTQKVIIVSGSTPSGSPSMLQRSLSVPIVKTVSAACPPASTSQQSLIINTQPHASPGAMGNVFTISTSTGNSNTVAPTSVSIGGVPATAYITSPKIRPKAVQLPAKPRPRAGSIVIPMTPNQLSGGTSVQLKSKPSLHIKQDTGMKIMPTSNVGSTAKILPKATTLTSTGQSPIYVMSSTTTGMSMVTRTVSSSIAMSGSPTAANTSGSTTVIARNTSKPLQALHISTQGGNIIRPSAGKPNVIVVQKGGASGFKTLSHSGKEMVSKVIMSKSLTTPLTVQKPTSATVQSGSLSNISSSQGNVIVLDLSQEQLSKNSVLAEILQASGIMTETSHAVTSTDAPAEGASKASDWVTVEADEKEACIPEPQQEVGVSMDVPQRVVTLEEAVELLGQTEFEENDAAGESGAGTNTKTEAGGEMMEVVGELDPQTGIYSLPSAMNSAQTVVKIVPRLSSTSRDIFSTALASADINLDTLQYIEDNIEELQGAEQQILSAEVNQEDSEDEQLSTFLQPGLSESTAVTVEPSNIDTTGMHIEDYASQKVQGSDIG